MGSGTRPRGVTPSGLQEILGCLNLEARTLSSKPHHYHEYDDYHYYYQYYYYSVTTIIIIMLVIIVIIATSVLQLLRWLLLLSLRLTLLLLLEPKCLDVTLLGRSPPVVLESAIALRVQGLVWWFGV